MTGSVAYVSFFRQTVLQYESDPYSLQCLLQLSYNIGLTAVNNTNLGNGPAATNLGNGHAATNLGNGPAATNLGNGLAATDLFNGLAATNLGNSK